MLKKRSAVICGLLAPLLVGALLTVCSHLTPNYSNLTQAVSELGFSGSFAAWIWNFGNIIIGALIVILAWGMYQEVGYRSTIAMPILVGLSGLGWLGTGLFPADVGFQPSLQTTLHLIMVSIHYLTFLIGSFVLSIQWKSNFYWKRWAVFSGMIGILAIASFFIPRSIPAGFSQRLGIAMYFIWILGLSISLKFSTKIRP